MADLQHDATPASGEPPTAPPARGLRRRTARRAARFLLALPLAIELLWLLVANLLLASPAGERLLAARTRRLRLRWEHGWSLYPGDLHLRGFALEQRLSRGAVRLAAARARGRVALAPLLRRELRFVGVRGDEVQLTRVTAVEGEQVPARALAARRRRPRWRVVLPAVELAELRRVEAGALELQGNGHARGSFAVVPGERLELRVDELVFDGVRSHLAGQPAGPELTLRGHARLGPYRPAAARGRAALAYLDAELSVSTAGPAGGTSGERPAGGRLLVRRGHLQPGSELRLPLALPASPATTRPPEEAELARDVPELHLVVRELPSGAELTVEVQAASVRLALADGELRSGPLRLVGSTRETALAHLLVPRDDLGNLPVAASCSALVVRGAHLGPVRLDLDVDRLAGELDAGALLRHRLDVRGLRGSGLDVAFVLAPADEKRAVPPRAAWGVTVGDAQLTGVRAVRVGEVVARGEGELDAGFALDPQGTLAVSRFAVRVADGRVDSPGLTAERITLDVDLALAPLAVHAGPRAVAAASSGSVRLAGEVTQLGFLRRLAAARPWVSIDGSGSLDLAVEVAAGRLQPSSRLLVTARTLRVSGLGYEARGSGEVNASVAAGEARLAVRGRGLNAWPQGAASGPPYLMVSGLDLALLTRDLDLAAAPADLRAELRLIATAPELRRFASLLPEAAGVTFAGGNATLQAELSADGARDQAQGTLRVEASNAMLSLPDLELAGAADLQLALATRELRAGRFATDGSRLDLDGVSWRERGDASGDQGWWARVEMPAGTLDWKRPVTAGGDATFVLRDSGPLVSLVARRRQLPRWVERVFTVRDVRGEARIDVDPGNVRVRSLSAQGGALELLARLRLAAGSRQGALYLGLGPLGLGAALDGERRDLRLLRPRHWYDSLPPLD